MGDVRVNCDLCFLKGAGKITEILERRPDLANWWADQEARGLGKTLGAGTFRKDRPAYRQLQVMAQRQTRLFADDEPSISCFCGD